MDRMAGEKRNIEEVCARLSAGTLALELAAACRDHAGREERVKALQAVMQRRYDALLAGGAKDAEVSRR
jgi:hypothetical protein